MTSSSTRHGWPWHTVLVAVLTLALVAWFLHALDFSALRAAFAAANHLLIGVAATVSVAIYVLRAWRWQALLAPLGGVSFRNSFRITVMGFTATNILPGRPGEVLRPFLLSRVSTISGAAGFATILIERLLDLASVTLLFGCFLLIAPIDVGSNVKVPGAIAAAVALGSLGAFAFGAGHPETLRRWSDRATSWIPGRLGAALTRLARTFVDGLAVMRRPGPLVAAAVLSMLIWLSLALAVWLTARAFGLTMSFPGTFLVLMFLVVGVAVPVPAGVGSFHYMFQLAATTFFGASLEEASAAAIALHAVSFLPISVLGLVFMAQDGWTLAKVRGVKSNGGLE
jgi:uncharacterized protein (TIRG00374 family)